ncbi:structural maintenance of chromosomes 56 smc5 smc6 [Anaeramoeba ignava]|uniref:Structural maintenance of chromosomes 56 smc5 smc6 n=1 Tax=Anaeramoeba ignava TaxID=1746090 RepID=A0A9Q0R5T9_ANAIG|nr:structural maintenance of chromosomes 56 smc5 smc6 [Anaeramoeba ignava]
MNSNENNNEENNNNENINEENINNENNNNENNKENNNENNNIENEMQQDFLENIDSDIQNIQNIQENLKKKKKRKKRKKEETNQTKEKIEKQAGIIEELLMENFMCHRKLKIRLNSGVNVIFGSNGSGKSAIFTALLFCLGAHTRLTNRGTNLKDLIRYGQNSCKVRVKLCNKGPIAFEPDKFGKHIYIEHKITRASSTYKIYNSKLEMISGKKNTLIQILDNFSIFIDNPIVIMPQDKVREFISKAKPQNLYRNFVRATGLEQMQKSVENAEKTIKNVANKEIKKKEAIVEKIEQEIKILNEAIEREQKYQSLKKEYHWALISQEEQKVRLSAVEMRKRADKLKQMTEGFEKAKKDLIEAESQISQFHEELDSIEAKSENIQEEKQEIQKKKKQVETEIRTKEKETKQIKTRMQDLKRQEQGKQRELKQAEDLMREYEERERRRKEKNKAIKQKIEELNTKYNELKKKKPTERNETVELERAVSEMTAQLRKSKDLENGFYREKKELKNQIRQSELSEMNEEKKRLSALGESTEKMKEVIDKNTRRFKTEPIGPLGLSIKLRDEKWMAVFQEVLGTVMKSFIVGSFEDQKSLQNLYYAAVKNSRLKNQEPGIFKTNFSNSRYNVKMPNINCTIFLQVLEIQDPIIYNCVIDWVKPETIALADSLPEARQILLNSRQYSLKVTKCYLVDGTLCMHKRSFSVMPPTKSRFFNPNQNYNVKIDKQAILSRISQIDIEIQNAQSQKSAFENQLKQHRSQIDKITKDIERAEREARTNISDLKYQIQRKKSKINEIEEEPPRTTPEISTEIEDIQKDLTRKKEKIERIEGEISQSKSELEEIKKKDEENFEKKRKCDKKQKEISTKFGRMLQQQTDAQNIVEKADTKRSGLLSEISHLDTTLEKNLKRLKDHTKECVKKSGSRIVTDKPLEELRDFMKKYKEDSKKLTNLDRKEILEKNEELQKVLRNISQTKSEIQTIEKRTENNAGYLNKKFNMFRTQIQQKFQKVLRLRRMRGSLVINLDEQKLFLNLSLTEEQLLLSSNKNIVSIESSQINPNSPKTSKKRNPSQKTKNNKNPNNINNNINNINNNKQDSSQIPVDSLDQKVKRPRVQSQLKNLSQFRKTKSFSGGEKLIVTVAYLLALWGVVDSPFYSIDEFDLYFDDLNRSIMFDLLIQHSLTVPDRQFIFITPLDVSFLADKENVTIFKLKDKNKEARDN